jgi:hypothetical protein
MIAEDVCDLPQPAPMAQHQADPDPAGWVWAMVEVTVERCFGPPEQGRMGGTIGRGSTCA